MSINLPSVNLSSVVVGSTGRIYMPPHGMTDPVNIGEVGHITLFNESGSGLQIDVNDGKSYFIPAGGWYIITLGPTATDIKWTVVYNLPNPPVTVLIAVYFFPGELVPDIPSLGNSPIGIGGSVQTSSVQTLSNEATATKILVIDMGESGSQQLVTMYNDGSVVHNVLQSSVVHNAIQIQSSGNAVLLGQAGDTSEVVGSLKVDQNGTIAGTLSTSGAGFTIDSSGNITKSGSMMNNGQLGVNSLGDYLDGSGLDTYLSSRGGANLVHVRNGTTDVMTFGSAGPSLKIGTIGLLHGGLSRISTSGISGVTCGSGTVISHGLGTTPDTVLIVANIAQPGSATTGLASVGATTFTATVGAGSSILFRAEKQ